MVFLQLCWVYRVLFCQYCVEVVQLDCGQCLMKLVKVLVVFLQLLFLNCDRVVLQVCCLDMFIVMVWLLICICCGLSLCRCVFRLMQKFFWCCWVLVILLVSILIWLCSVVIWDCRLLLWFESVRILFLLVLLVMLCCRVLILEWMFKMVLCVLLLLNRLVWVVSGRKVVVVSKVVMVIDFSLKVVCMLIIGK